MGTKHQSNPDVFQVSTAELFRLAEVALSGRPAEASRYLRKLATKYKSTEPAFSAKMVALLRSKGLQGSVLRGVDLAVAPVDRDSRLSLVKTEEYIEVGFEPIWSEFVSIQLNQLIEERQRIEDLRGAGLSPAKSVLFVGPPGVGKTLAARWLASKLNLTFHVLDLSVVISSFLGRTGSNLRNVFDFAKDRNCLLLLDELDAIAKRRQDDTEIGELKRLVTVLIQELDQWPDGSLLVAATNHPDLLDPAIWRRFDVRVEFPMPAIDQVKKALDLFLGEELQPGEEWTDILSVILSRLSYSDIEQFSKGLRREAVIANKGIEEVCKKHVLRDLKHLNRNERHSVAKKLIAKGISQRQISQWTGVSRDTLRKKLGD